MEGEKLAPNVFVWPHLCLEHRLATVDENVTALVTYKIKRLESRTTDSPAATVEQAVKEELRKNWKKTRILKHVLQYPCLLPILLCTTLLYTGYQRTR